MDFNQILPIIIGVIALAIGIGAGKFLFAKDTRKQLNEAAQQAEKILADARSQSETLKKEKMLEAKEKFVQLRGEHDKEVLEKNKKIKIRDPD
jgi:ribonuclease Y